jgi:hypothetical protein
VFLAIYIGLCLIWAVLNSFALNLIALIDIVSMYWQVRLRSLKNVAISALACLDPDLVFCGVLVNFLAGVSSASAATFSCILVQVIVFSSFTYWA